MCRDCRELQQYMCRAMELFFSIKNPRNHNARISLLKKFRGVPHYLEQKAKSGIINYFKLIHQ